MITPAQKVRIKIKLINNNLSQTALAAEFGCTKQQLNNVINGKVSNLRLELLLKERLGMM